MAKRALLAAAMVAVLAFTGTPVSAAEPPTHWLRPGPAVVITVFDELHDAAWSRILRASVAEWNAGIDNIDVVFGVGAADCVKGHGRDTVVVCLHQNSQPNHRGEVIWYRDADWHLTHALLWIDTPRHHPKPNRASLMCHEFGHVLGLEHRADGAKTCMTPTASSNHPDAQDFQTVTAIHAHTHR